MKNYSHVDIVVVVPHIGLGGSQAVAIRIANALADRGLKVDLLIVANKKIELNGISESVNQLRLNGSHSSLSIFSIYCYLKKVKPKNILSIQGSENIICAAVRMFSSRKSRLLVSEHNNLSLRLDVPKWRAKAATLGRRFFYPLSDLIVCVSQSVMDDLKINKVAPDTPKIVVYNPLDLSAVRDRSFDKCEHKFFNAGGPLILSFGRLEAQKDYKTLIQAFSHLPREMEAHLIILGEGSQRETLQNQIHGLGLSDKVDMPGHCINPYAYLSRSDIFVMSSIYEGNPLSMVEALSCGVPVVSTRFNGVLEILGEDRKYMTVPIGNAVELSNAIQEVLMHPPNADDLLQIASYYDVPNIIDRYLEFLDVS